MEYIYHLFDNQSHIIINTPKPEDFTDWQDILVILLYEYPKVKPNYVYVGNPHENLSVVVGDNINFQGMVKIQLKKNNQLNQIIKGENNNAKQSKWQYFISYK